MDQGIAQIMTAEVTCVGEGASLDDLRELLLERGLHCVPVVAAEGRPVGVVTQTDLLRTISQLEDPESAEGDERGAGREGNGAREGGAARARLGTSPRSTGQMAALRERTAGDIMTALVFALPVTASVEQAAALMAYEGVEQLVVTSLDGEVAGLVRALDVARSCARSAGYLVDREE